MTKYLFEIFCWLVFVVLCGIAAVIGRFTPWIGATLVVVIWAVALAVAEWRKLGIMKGFVLCVLCPFIGTFWKTPSLGLGEYEWLIGIWVTAFIVGYFGGKELIRACTSPSVH